MPTLTYHRRRGELETYFDRTAAHAWAQLTSDAPVSKIRATVRAGRDAMRATLLDWLPADLSGRRVLDAGCGTGALAVAAARRGAEVVAVDLSPTLVGLARERLPDGIDRSRITFEVGDFMSAGPGDFDHIVAMDSLIHYKVGDIMGVLARLAPRARRSVLFTFAPRTPALTLMHAVGKLMPKGDRAPSIEPVAESTIRRRIAAGAAGLETGRARRIASGFYTSHAMELVRP